ncbi:MAG: serine hydrolase domain-containing protein [Gemmatimonadota bacterium]
MKLEGSRRRRTRSVPILVLMAGLGCGSVPARQGGGGAPGQWPRQADGEASGRWLQYAMTEDAGFSSAELDEVRAYADSVRSGAVMAVYRGRVLVAWGDVAREFEAHSVRKSMVSALYGIAVAEGRVDLDATLAELGIDDIDPLTEDEKRARVRDLLAARSGVYHPAAYADADQHAARPERGAHAPGERFFYNNWDFNAAGVIYERATGEDLYRVFGRRVADRLGMEDYEPDDGYRAYEPTRSRHPAHTFRISTRDLARFGQLYLQGGRWDGREVVPEEWIRESTRPVTDLGGGTGYGYMWWTYSAGALSAERYPALARHDLHLARGSGGQAVFVIPGADLVVVHRGDTDHGVAVAGPAVWTLVERILAARESEPSAEPSLVALRPTPLASQSPAPEPERFLELSPEALEPYIGEYESAPGAVARVFMFDGSPYIHVPGEGDAELFALARDEFTVRVVPGVRIEFERDGSGEVTHVVVTIGGQTLRGRKRS